MVSASTRLVDGGTENQFDSSPFVSLLALRAYLVGSSGSFRVAE